MNWTYDKLHDVMKTHSNPSTLDGFTRKSYCGKGQADLRVADSAREFISKITTDTRDRDNEIVVPKGVDFKEYLKNPVILWSHNYADPAIGRSLWIKRWSEDDRVRGHIAKGVVANGVQKAEDVFKLMQQNILNTVSIGFVPIKGHTPTPDEIKQDPSLKDIKYIHDKSALLEYSIVNVPSNPEATIDAVSKGLIDIPVSLQQDMGIYIPVNAAAPIIDKKSIPYMQTSIDGIEAGWNKAAEVSSATFDDLPVMAAWFDSDLPEFKASYKFIHHRANNGNPLVWLGLVESMSTLNIFTDLIPQEHRKAVWKHLAKHYQEFGKEPPELKSTAMSFGVHKLPLCGITTQETPTVAGEPFVIKEAFEAKEVKPVSNVGDSENIVTAAALETFEVKTLGRV